MRGEGGAVDLLTLIGDTIDRLRRSIELFEGSKQCAGVEHLSAVIEGIDVYLKKLDGDPLLKLASLPPARVREGLHHVREDLCAVIHDVQHSTR